MIVGGYDAGCNTRFPNALLTLLDGNFAYQVMNLRSHAGEIDISGVTIQNGETSADGGGLEINPSVGENGAVGISDSIIRSNHTSTFAGGLLAANGSGHFVVLSSSLIVGNSADLGVGGAVLTDVGNGVAFYNNTVYNNTTLSSSASAVDCVDCGGNHCEVSNNIFWNNSHIGIRIGSTTALFDYNDYGTLGGGSGITENIGNQQVAPKFVDAAGGDYHLAGNSTLLGVSPILLSGTDLDGHAYPAGGLQDMGAFEETIFTDGGFENPPAQ